MVKPFQKPFSLSGFTLVEMMVTVAVLGVLFSIGPSLFNNFTKFTRLSSAQLEIQRGSRTSLSQINRNLRQAVGSTIVISQETGQPPYSNISFTTVDSRSVKYYQQGTTLFVVDGATVTLAKGLRYISFLYPRTDDTGIVSVSLTFEQSTYERGTKSLQMAIEKVRVMN